MKKYASAREMAFTAGMSFAVEQALKRLMEQSPFREHATEEELRALKAAQETLDALGKRLFDV